MQRKTHNIYVGFLLFSKALITSDYPVISDWSFPVTVTYHDRNKATESVEWLGRKKNDAVFDRGGLRGLFLCYSTQTSSEAHPASYQIRTENYFFRGQNGQGVKLTAHNHLTPRSWLSEPIPPLRNVLTAWCLISPKDNIFKLQDVTEVKTFYKMYPRHLSIHKGNKTL